MPLAPSLLRPALRRGAAVAALAAALAAAAPAAAATLEVTGVPGAAVSINGVGLGALPLAGPVTVEPGTYVVEAVLRGYGDFARTIRIDDDADEVSVFARMAPLSRRTAWTGSVLYAGLGQFYTGHRTRGWIYAAAETGGLLTALGAELQRTNDRKDYLVLMDAYYATINADEATAYRNEATSMYNHMKDMESLRNTGLLVAAAAVGLSVIDALVTFPAVETGPGTAPTTLGRADGPASPSTDPLGAYAAVKLTF